MSGTKSRKSRQVRTWIIDVLFAYDRIIPPRQTLILQRREENPIPFSRNGRIFALHWCIPSIMPHRYYWIFFIFLAIGSCHQATDRRPDYVVQGIDVSHHQSWIDWSLLPDQGIHFAYIKATEGGDLVDSLFRYNWCEAQSVGIRRGAYHYFRPNAPVLDQVLNYIREVDLEPGDLPPVLDVETMDGVTNEQLVEKVRAWLTMVEIHYRTKPILYSYQRFYNQHLASAFSDYPVWIARYSERVPELRPLKEWHFWQYGDRGELAGIKGPVDFNAFSGNPVDLEELLVKPQVLAAPSRPPAGAKP